MRSALSLVFAGLVVAACGGSTPQISIPPINIPTIPPINIPSNLLPSNLPTMPPIEIPSNLLPSVDPSNSACTLVTADEMAAVFGGAVTMTADESGSCQITPPNEFIPITLRRGVNESLDVARQILDDEVELTVGGNPAVYGNFVGDILYVDKGGQVLVIQAALQEGVQDKLVGIAEAALQRFP
jgi:hypothetical protein